MLCSECISIRYKSRIRLVVTVGVLRPTAFVLVPKHGSASAADLDADIVEVPAGGRDAARSGRSLILVENHVE